MRQFLFTSVLFFITNILVSAQNSGETQNLILITFDGLRWQEVFKGAEKRLLEDAGDLTGLNDNTEISRQQLMPFMWNVIAKNGQIYGNREYKNKVDLTNNFWFSYPGYNEILTGIRKDKKIFSMVNYTIQTLPFWNI
ncbi:MAG: hypothetical protein HC830_06855 [Bacteroidetes bacterium]|nr:hypothetical protein [Bacteroidota bacterium]